MQLKSRPSRKVRLPAVYPVWAVKCVWHSTAITIKVRAKTEEDAWNRAASQVKRMEGGMSCLELRVLGVTS